MAADEQEQRAGALRNLAELAGCLMFVGFLYLCWPPLALLGGAVLLVVWANFTRPAASRRVARTVGAAFGAANKAWRDAQRSA